MRKFFILLTIISMVFLVSCNNSKKTETTDGDVLNLDGVQNDSDAKVDEVVEVESNTDIEQIDGDSVLDDSEETADFDTIDSLVITKKVELQTTMGNIVLGLYGKEMPKTTENFLTYVKQQFYDGLIFHRVIKGFVIQGGGFFPDMQVNPATEMPLEFEKSTKVKHVKYALSMARAQDINSATTQFFITLAPQPSLDYTSDDDFTNPKKYPCAAFGIVLKGMDVVDKIGDVETDKNDLPKTQILIKKAFVVK